MPLALLLSPDDQAVSAITAVLEEMSVNCERPLDGISAAQKLNSSNFDLVLVDCENLPAAKLIFDVCRRGKGGPSPVPIAIVDGRAGLPTAFRLGAELILTKPVAKDQARNTIRTAVGRLKKDDATVAAEAAITAAASPAATASQRQDSAQADHAENDTAAQGESTQEIRAIAAVQESPSVARAASAAATGEATISTHASQSTAEAESSAARKPSLLDEVRTTIPAKPSDDPVLAELEKPYAQVPTPVFSSYAGETTTAKKRKSRGPLVAILVLVMLGVGTYGAWMYAPGFRALAQPQVDRAAAMVGMTRAQSQNAASLPRPAVPAQPPDNSAAPMAPGQAAATADGATAAPTPEANSADSSAGPQSSVPPATAPSSAAPVNPSATVVSTKGVAALTGTASSTLPGKSENVNVSIATGDNSKTTPNEPGNAQAASDDANAELPGEKTAVILSSKGAEKRLSYSVPATYPTEARPHGTEGTVVLKAVIDESGKVAGTKVVEGDPVLASAATRAVRQWRYRPYLRDGKPVTFQTIVLVDFQKP
jgi:periplasmic protein TonB